MGKRKTRRSFDLFSAFSYYVPGAGGIFMLLIMFIIGAVIGNAAMLGLTVYSSETAETYGMLVSYPLMFLPPMLYAAYQSRKNEYFEGGYLIDSSNFGNFSGLSIAIAVSVATLAAAFAMDFLNIVMPPMPEKLEAMMSSMMEGPFWVTILAVSVFAPFFEEWLCRGMILRGLLQRMKPAWAIVISALVFALIHLNPWQAIPAFVFGVIFGYVYYRTGSLKLTMLMHCVNNTFSAVIGRIEIFKDAESFLDVFSTGSYIALSILCAAMVVFFFFRIHSIPIPSGQTGGCTPVRFGDGQ